MLKIIHFNVIVLIVQLWESILNLGFKQQNSPKSPIN